MLVGKRRCHSSSRRALDEAFHDEERLVNLLYGAAILAYCRGNGAYAYRTATELVDDGGEMECRCAVILRRICQLSLTRITNQVSRAFDLNN